MDVKSWRKSLSTFFSKDKSIKLLVGLGLCGIVLIYVSSLFGSSPKEKAGETDSAQSLQSSYEEKLKRELEEIVSAITGEGSPTVMVTLESGTRSVYAADENSKQEPDSGSRETEKFHVILKESDGSQRALTVMEIQPEIKGVVIVSNGAGDPVTREKLVNAAKTALGVSASRVCVTCGG